VPSEIIAGMGKARLNKGGGGSAHDRAVRKAQYAEQPCSLEAPAAPTQLNHQRQVSRTERVLRFIDHGSTQTLVGLIGGLAGTFLDGRYYAVLGLMVSFGLHKSKALEGVSRKLILPIHIIAVVTTAAVLLWMGIQINKSRPQAYTPADYANAVTARLPLPITQQITNIYNSYVSPARQIGEPRIDLSEYIYDGNGPDGMYFHTSAVNNGTVPALDVAGTSKSAVMEESTKSEDELFDRIASDVNDKVQPRRDLAPGTSNSVSERSLIPFPTTEEKSELQSNKNVLYLGRIDSYHDAKGHKYETELCMYFISPSPRFYYCYGHNKTRQVE
jgi:hypothetical protein